MRPIRLSTLGVSKTVPIPLDLYLVPFNVSLRAVITGAPTYTVEYTEDDVYAVGYDPDAGSSKWKALDGMTDAVADAYTTLTSPVTAVRMRQTVGAAPNGVELTVLQAGVMG